MTDITLLSPGRVDGFDTRNRLFMAPMTRNRALAGGVPAEMSVAYYRQRASAGLIITEGTAPSAGGIGYVRTPAIETPEQVAAWRAITEAVHAEGGRMFMQFMHVGRIGHSANRYVDEPLIAPSAVRAAGQIRTDAGLEDFEMPRALETHEIPGVIEQYAQATRNAFAAGFDGVELHCASGYLPMQFLSTGTNRRTDRYGGDASHRIRFAMEVLDAMADAAGTPSRVGVKISPGIVFNDITDDDPVETYTTFVKALAPLGLAYLHVVRTPPMPTIFEILRPHYPGTFAAGGAFDFATGNAMLASGAADFIVFGKLFTSNPDLPHRFASGSALTPFDTATFYTGGAKGYTDYPPL